MTGILVVDDDPAILRTLSIGLRARLRPAGQAVDGTSAIALGRAEDPDLVILDLGLPDISGLEVLRRTPNLEPGPRHRAVRQRRVGRQGRVLRRRRRRLRHQAVRHRRFLARARAAVRRAGSDQSAQFVQTPAFRIDLAAKQVWRDSTEVRLTPTEWGLLLALVVLDPAASSRNAACSTRSGDPRTARKPTTCACTWRTCAVLEPDPSRPRQLHHRTRHGLPIPQLTGRTHDGGSGGGADGTGTEQPSDLSKPRGLLSLDGGHLHEGRRQALPRRHRSRASGHRWCRASDLASTAPCHMTSRTSSLRSTSASSSGVWGRLAAGGGGIFFPGPWRTTHWSSSATSTTDRSRRACRHAAIRSVWS